MLFKSRKLFKKELEVNSIKGFKGKKKFKIKMDQLTYNTKVIPLFWKSLKSKDIIKHNFSNLDLHSDYLNLKNLFYFFNNVYITNKLIHEKWVALMRRSFYGISLRRGYKWYIDRKLRRNIRRNIYYLRDTAPLWFQNKVLIFYPFLFKHNFNIISLNLKKVIRPNWKVVWGKV